MILDFQNISKSFDNTLVLKDLKFGIFENSILGLIGPNGSGKTTFLNIVAGLIKPDSGKIYKSKNSLQIGVNIGTKGFFSEFTVQHNLKILSQIREGRSSCKSSVTILEKLGFTDFEKKYKNLSLGNKQKVSISSTFIGNPALILLDEPYNALEIEAIISLRELMISEKEKTSFILTSHNFDEIQRVADRIVIIKKGKIVSDNSTFNIIEESGNLENYYKNLHENQ